jgi:hypothetical protein
LPAARNASSSAATQQLHHVIKYSGLLGGAFRIHRTEQMIREVAEKNLASFLQADTRLASGVIGAGAAYGIDVELLWWLYGPFRCPGPLTILRSVPSNLSTQSTE